MYGELRFVIVGPDGSVLFHLNRIGTDFGDWDGQLMQVHDGAGRDIGRLRTTAPVAQFSQSSGATLGFEYNRQWLGATEVRQFQDNKPIPIFDGNGTVIAQIRHRQLATNSRYVRYSDYLLDCPHPMPHPMPEFMLIALFNQYLYERLLQGPLNSMFGLYG